MRKTVRHNNHFTLKSIGERSTTHILDLPEEIFRIIFSYIAEAEVYFKLRVVCSQLREYAEKYVELGKIKAFETKLWSSTRFFQMQVNNNFDEIKYLFRYQDTSHRWCGLGNGHNQSPAVRNSLRFQKKPKSDITILQAWPSVPWCEQLLWHLFWFM